MNHNPRGKKLTKKLIEKLATLKHEGNAVVGTKLRQTKQYFENEREDQHLYDQQNSDLKDYSIQRILDACHKCPTHLTFLGSNFFFISLRDSLNDFNSKELKSLSPKFCQ